MMKIVFLLVPLMISCANHHHSNNKRYQFLKRVESMGFSSPRGLSDADVVPMPVKAGQWVTFFTRPKGLERFELGLTTYKVLKIENNLTTMEIEVETMDESKKIIIVYDIENYPSLAALGPIRGEMEDEVVKMTFKRVVLKQGQEPAQEMPKDVLQSAGAITRKSLAHFYRLGNIKLSECSSPYLKSKTCHVYVYEGEVAGRTGRGVVWAHSQIPIVHFIQSEDDKSITQVINYGTDGAVNSLPQ